MIIEKTATNKNYIREFKLFQNARNAFKFFLNECFCNNKKGIILLPSYIGYSTREGSGVFDPVKELGIKYDFYKMNEYLTVDITDLEKKFIENEIKVFVLIHYFGHIDVHYNDIIKLARKYNCIILEDEAHALYSDIIDGTSGRLGDACIFSLHKMLPEKMGGMLVLNNKNLFKQSISLDQNGLLFKYDLQRISKKRKMLSSILDEYIRNMSDVTPLWNLDIKNETLQTYPIIIKNSDRNEIYKTMNEKGFGVVSLYHTLIKEIEFEKYKESYKLSKKILNLPIHQDVNEKQIIDMVNILSKTLKEQK